MQYVKTSLTFCQGVFILSYLNNNIKYLKKVPNKCLWISYMINHMKLHPGGNSVEPEFVNNVTYFT